MTQQEQQRYVQPDKPPPSGEPPPDIVSQSDRPPPQSEDMRPSTVQRVPGEQDGDVGAVPPPVPADPTGPKVVSPQSAKVEFDPWFFNKRVSPVEARAGIVHEAATEPGSLTAATGIIPAAGERFAVTLGGAPGAATVTVGTGKCTVGAGAGDYGWRLTVPKASSLKVPVADPTNPRDDRLVVRVHSEEHGDSETQVYVELLTGIPGKPAPDVPAHACNLGVVHVPVTGPPTFTDERRYIGVSNAVPRMVVGSPQWTGNLTVQGAISRLTIQDPGYPYIAYAQGGVHCGWNNGGKWALEVRLDDEVNGQGNNWPGIAQAGEAANFPYMQTGPPAGHVLTGTHILFLVVRCLWGASTIGVYPGGGFTALIVPAVG